MRLACAFTLATPFVALGCAERDAAAAREPAPPTPERTVPVDAAATGTVVLVVRLTGELPEPRELDVSREPACANDGPLVSEALVHSEGLLQGALVHAVSGHEAFAVPPPAGEPTLTQSGCRFRPHVLALRAGQLLRIENADSVLHNVRLRPERNPASNRAQAAGAEPLLARFERPELAIPVQCDLHPWMGAWLHVLDHPWFAVTGRDGEARLLDVPAGDYELEVRHEVLGTRRLAVTVSPGAETRAEATFRVDPGS